MDQTGALKNWWFLALALSVMIWNVSAINVAGTWTTPHTMVGLRVPNISPYLCFELYQEVYYICEGGLKSPSIKERKARRASIAPAVGNDMTWTVIDDITGQAHHCSFVQPAKDLFNPNLRADNLSSKDIKAGLEASKQPVAKSFMRLL